MTRMPDRLRARPLLHRVVSRAVIAPGLIPVTPGARGADYLPAADRARAAEHSSPRSFARRSNPLSRSRAYVDQLGGFPNSPSDVMSIPTARW